MAETIMPKTKWKAKEKSKYVQPTITKIKEKNP
jgi:hypothetical protein